MNLQTWFTLELTPDEEVALTRLRDEDFPQYTLDRVLQKVIRDGLVGAGVLGLPARDRGPGARASARRRSTSRSSRSA